MATITLTIPDEKLQRVKDGLLEVFPNNETKADPNWVDPEDGSSPPQVNKYTDNQWLKEVVRRFVRDTVVRGETAIAKRAVAIPSADADIS